MATRLYLRSDDAGGGLLPSTEQSSASNDNTGSPFPIKTLSLTKGSTATLTNGGTKASAAAQKDCTGMWISPPLVGDQVINLTSLLIALVAIEGNTNANFSPNSIHCYVWRPLLGIKVGTIIDQPGAGTFDATAAEASTSHYTSIVYTISSGFSSVSALDGDVIIIEPWGLFTQSSALAQTFNIRYNGTIEPGANGSSTNLDAAPYVTFSQTIVFAGGVQVGATSVAAATTAAFAGRAIVPATLSIAATATVAGNSKTFGVGAASIAGSCAVAGVGRKITPRTIAIASSANVAMVSAIGPSFPFCNFAVAATLELDAVGLQHLPHVFEKELPAPDSWVKEARL